MSVEKWICACKALLGFVEDKRIIRIKRKDLYIEVEGGKVTRNCTKCGKPNTLIDKTDLEKGVSKDGVQRTEL